MIALTLVTDLPRTTPMNAVRDRARADGRALAGSDGVLAAFAAVAEVGVEGATHNSFAIVSVWANSSRMSAFLWGETMASIERDLARPSGRLWAVTSVQLDRARVLKATHVGITVVAAAQDRALATRVDDHKGAVSRALAGKSTALAARGIDVASWDECALDAWTGRPRTYAGRVFQVVSAAAPERG